MLRRFLLLSIGLFFIALFAKAQQSGPGSWRAHLPFRSAISVAEAGNRVYCASRYSLFYYDRDDLSLNRLSKVNGLSDVDISTIRYAPDFKTLLVAYTNANIDLITEDRIINISDIKRKNIFGKKTINAIFFLGRYAYLSCGFGIVVLDMDRHEVYDTYYIGPLGTSLEVHELSWDGSDFWAATAKGIYRAEAANTNLANYEAWIKDTTLPFPDGQYTNICRFRDVMITSLEKEGYGDDTLMVFDGNLWTNMLPGTANDYKALIPDGDHLLVAGNGSLEIFNDSLHSVWNIYDYNPGSPAPMSAFEDDEGFFWIADNKAGLVKNKGWSSEFILPNGPASNSVYSMLTDGSNLYVAPGSLSSSLGNTYNAVGPYTCINNTWYNLKDMSPALDSLWDVLYTAVDPRDAQRVFYSTWGHGIVEFRNGHYYKDYSYTNSGLEKPFQFYNWVGVSGIAFDEYGNLWVVNSECNNLLKVLKKDETWQSYTVSSVISQPKATQLMIDANHQKWIVLYGASGIIVFNDNNTLDDKSDDHIKRLTSNLGNGNLPSNTVYTIAEDLDGEIWVGTDKGLAVFYTPNAIFSGSNFDAQVITIEQDSTAQHLLEYETVTSIAVDGANKKWVGTQNAGVFLFSEDGQKEIHHFTAENSPLLSNTIIDIAIDGNSGEVYFGTDKGICSFMGYATTGKASFEGVYAYPNPVEPGFNGTIGIRGLTRDAWVKITDINGVLIYETRSEGGQAVWDGHDFTGQKAKTGVYPVIIISDDGSEKIVTKILIVN